MVPLCCDGCARRHLLMGKDCDFHTSLTMDVVTSQALLVSTELIDSLQCTPLNDVGFLLQTSHLQYYFIMLMVSFKDWLTYI